jgi:tetratricopeptide (TPR) repeat protein
MTDIPFSGDVKDISLSKLLANLNRNRKTGTLVIKAPVFTKKVYLIKGDAIFASSTYEDDRLGEMLIKAGKITMEQYDRSVELLKQTGKRQGAILVELGYLTPKDLFWGVKYQVKEIIYSLFQIEDAKYEFIEGEIPTNEVITLKMSMGNLIYEGVRRIDNWTRIRREMPDANTILKLSTNPLTLFQDIELTPQDRKMLATVDGNRTIKELINGSWIGSFEAMKILYVLWSIGIVEEKQEILEQLDEEMETITFEDILQPVSEEEEVFRKRVDEIYSTLNGISANNLLEVGENPDEETLIKNYYRLSKEFHPDRYFASDDPSIKDKLTAIFDAITQAYNQLKDSVTSKEEVILSEKKEEQTQEVSAARDAEDHFKHGIEEFKKGNFWEAVDSLKWATNLDTTNAKYWSYLSLALTKIPNGLKDAEKALFEAIKIEPDNAEHYVNLGMIYIKAGMKKRAHSQFEKALELNPDNVKAKKGLEKTKA